jgi:hypothetical protein
MAYGKIKADSLVYDNNGDVEVTVQSLAGAATQAYVDTAIANLSDSAPTTLDTLNELAAALGDDANFSTTVTNSIAAKLPLAGGTLTGALTATDVTVGEALTIERVREKVGYYTTGAGTTVNLWVKDQTIYYTTGSPSGNWTINITGNNTTTLDSIMDVGQSITTVYAVTYGATAYYPAGIQIDGATNNRTLKWVGGAPSSAGTANAICAVTATVIKTAANTFTVLASKAEYE